MDFQYLSEGFVLNASNIVLVKIKDLQYSENLTVEILKRGNIGLRFNHIYTMLMPLRIHIFPSCDVNAFFSSRKFICLGKWVSHFALPDSSSFVLFLCVQINLICKTFVQSLESQGWIKRDNISKLFMSLSEESFCKYLK